MRRLRSIHLGHYLSHPVRMPRSHPPSVGPETVEVLRTEERGSDVNLASYLLLDGFRGDCEATVVISNDSDLKVPHPPARRSRAPQPTFWRQVRSWQLQRSQFPPILGGCQGNDPQPGRLVSDDWAQKRSAAEAARGMAPA